MIRRGFWVMVGAVGGVMGDRRIVRGTKRAWARETIRFTRDVRDGMDLYSARHQGRSGPTLGASEDNDEKDDR